ncbi:MAG: N-6 DNA methylase [Myxococcales bacterium]
MSADALIAEFEQRKSRALGNALRREAGLYYTPPDLASFVVELALRYGSGSLLDPCAGAGAFLLAAARAGVTDLRGIDLDAAALRVARRVVPQARLRRGDSLRIQVEPADLVVSNPPYGHVRDAWLAQRFPALKGGEIDRYAAFILRSLELVRPGGVVALLIPDTWMFLSRAWRLRAAAVETAEIAAIVDLGKPFASAKDTRVQALVMVRKPAAVRKTRVGRGREDLAPVEGLGAAPWFVYRTREEQALCDAIDRASVPLGTVCEVGYGLRTGNNRLHVARRAPRRGEIGLVGGEDIVPFELRWRPKTLVKPGRLLDLAGRQLGRPRVAIQRIRTNSKAPWARWLEAAMVPPGLVCLDSLSTLAALSEELLHALLALVSSVPMNRYHRLHTTDVNVKPSALRTLPVPRALLEDPGGLARLTDHRAIDAEVYALFGLPRALVEACERGFWANRFPEEFQRLEQAMSDPLCSVGSQEGIA